MRNSSSSWVARVSRALVPALLVASSIVGLAPAARADGRQFVLAEDARSPGTVEGMYTLNVGVSGAGALRFVDPVVAREGVVQRAGAQESLTPWLALGAFGLAEVAGASGAGVRTAGGGYVSLSVLRPRAEDGGEARDGLSLGVQVWASRELEGGFSLSTWLNAGYQRRALSLAGNLQLEKRFAVLADPLDVIVRLGVSVEVARSGDDGLRLGLEYVGQDLEDLIEHEDVEGGALHLIAPALTAVLADRRLSVGVAPGLVAGARGVGFGGRLMIAYAF